MARTFLLALALLCSTGGRLNAAPADAGAAPASQPATAPASSIDRDPAEGMLLNDARDAAGELALAQHLERQHDWAKAAVEYQELLAAYGNRVFPSRLDPDNLAIQYANFGRYIQGRIAHWPSVGVGQYRAKYEASAKTLLEAAGPDGMAALDRVCSLYYCTDNGKQAALRMIDHQMEAGEFAAAAIIGDRLLSVYPDLQTDRPVVLYRTALAWRYSGNAKSAAERGDELKRQFPSSRGIVRGEKVLLADSLMQELAVIGENWQPTAAGPPRGGSLSPGRLGDSDARPGPRLYSIAVDAPTFPPIQRAAGGMPIQRFDRLGEGRTIGILPVVDRGELFFQDGEHLFAVDLATGSPLPGWLKTYPKGVFTLPGLTETSRGHQLSITLTDRQVLAIMAHPDQQSQDETNMNNGAAIKNQGLYLGEPRLVCLDRATGAELWSAVLSQLPDSARDARTMQMIGSPLVIGSEVLVTARGKSKLRDFENVYVLAFDLNTGAFRWSTFIAAHEPVMMGMFNFRSIPAEQAEVATHLAYANGLVYVQSNLGVLAALDPWGGQISWLDIMPIGRTPPKTGKVDPFWAFRLPQPFDHKPWSFNPVIIAQGRLFTMPSEGLMMHICDPLTGEELNRFDLNRLRKAAPDPGSNEVMPLKRSSCFDTIIGIRGDDIVLSSDRTLYCLDWKNYNPFAPDPLAGNITKWKTVLPTQTRGRPYMTDRQILVPCENHLYCLNPDTGKINDMFPAAGNQGDIAWKSPDEPGNVLATQGYVVIAGADAVNVYRDPKK
jgi:outer membrane protein assembly factor BamB